MIVDTGTITTIIQSAVAPVFLLVGVAGLLNVFTGRLARIMDKLAKMDAYVHAREKKDKHYQEDEKRLERRNLLLKRMGNTNLAIFFCTATGLMVAIIILTIFASVLFAFHTGTLVSLFFIVAMISLIISLILFLREIYFTTSTIRIRYYTHNCLDKK
jgi:uncharacterized membrane protein YcjF (UPF0283 family)